MEAAGQHRLRPTGLVHSEVGDLVCLLHSDAGATGVCWGLLGCDGAIPADLAQLLLDQLPSEQNFVALMLARSSILTQNSAFDISMFLPPSAAGQTSLVQHV